MFYVIHVGYTLLVCVRVYAGRWVFNLLYYVSVDARGCNRLLSYDILDRVSTTFEVTIFCAHLSRVLAVVRKGDLNRIEKNGLIFGIVLTVTFSCVMSCVRACVREASN